MRHWFFLLTEQTIHTGESLRTTYLIVWSGVSGVCVWVTFQVTRLFRSVVLSFQVTRLFRLWLKASSRSLKGRRGQKILELVEWCDDSHTSSLTRNGWCISSESMLSQTSVTDRERWQVTLVRGLTHPPNFGANAMFRTRSHLVGGPTPMCFSHHWNSRRYNLHLCLKDYLCISFFLWELRR